MVCDGVRGVCTVRRERRRTRNQAQEWFRSVKDSGQADEAEGVYGKKVMRQSHNEDPISETRGVVGSILMILISATRRHSVILSVTIMIIIIMRDEDDDGDTN